MLSVLASGTLIRDPEQRTSAAGKTYCTTLLRAPTEGEDAALVSVIAFSSTAVQQLLAHAKGDSIAVTGRGKLTSWTDKAGGEKHGLSVVAEGVLTPYQLEKRRARARGDDAKPAAEQIERTARAMAAEGRAQVLSAPPGTAGGLATMPDDVPF
jgi:single-stranded DNA-binding protein